ncbi:hypothetical protein [Amycolatopsis sp. BJA-103]|uniref:hypothetical protein n=1 Tax=Amycolatopsis sp. BJA-103 TaxID=1911175 RepID=UPI00143D8F19|nr:hypothetical protein [Amycolatopsis sp. BJA-103]
MNRVASGSSRRSTCHGRTGGGWRRPRCGGGGVWFSACGVCGACGACGAAGRRWGGFWDGCGSGCPGGGGTG